MAIELYIVIPLEANLRSNTRIQPSSVITRLRQGQVVQRVVTSPVPPKGWLRVRAEIQGTPVEGFIKAFLLKKTQQAPVPSPPPVLPTIRRASKSVGHFHASVSTDTTEVNDFLP